MPLKDFDTLMAAASFAGMVPSEVAIMKQFIVEHANQFDRVDFEVRLGEGGTPSPTMTPDQVAAYQHLTKKRADAVFYDGNKPVIVEVKKRLRIHDLGQLLGYRLLYIQQHPTAPEPSMRAIGRYADNDALAVLTTHGITVELYPEA